MVSEEWISYLASPTPIVIAITTILVLLLPLILHFAVYRSSSTTLPTYILSGPSESGKTSFLTLLERGLHADSRISQTPLTVECSLPVDTPAASSRFRSQNDPSNQAHKKFLLVDTPGHGKLRHFALDSIVNPQNVRGIIFMLDAASLSAGDLADVDSTSLKQTAEYLHDILLVLQRRAMNPKAVRDPTLPVLVAANKMDLFTALPAPLVKTALEKEITKIRASRRKGLLDSGVGMAELNTDEDLGHLDDEDGKFNFTTASGLINARITVAGGNVTGDSGSDVQQWWDWIANSL